MENNENEMSWEHVNTLIDRLPDGPLKERVETIQNHFVDMAANPEYTADRALLDFTRQLQIDKLAGELYNADREWVNVFDVSEPSLKSYEDIATALGFDNLDEMFGSNGYQTMNAQELRAKLERLEPNVPFNKMLNYLTNGQVQHRRELILEGYDIDGNIQPLNWAASALQGIFTPRVKEAYLRGEDPTFRDYVGDILESASMAVPAGAFRGAATRAFGGVAPKVAAKVGNIAGRVANSPVAGRITKMATNVADNAASPAISQAYDYAMYDDPTNWRSQTNGWDFGRTALGTATNVLTPRMARAFGSGIASKMTDATGKADRKFVDFVSRGLASLGRDKDAEIAEAAARRAGILKRVPSRADELSTADVRRWANETADVLPTEQEYATALTEQAVSDWLDNVNEKELQGIMARSNVGNELKIPTANGQAGTITPDNFGFVKTPAGTVTTPTATMPTAETSATATALSEQLATLEKETANVTAEYAKTGERALSEHLDELARQKKDLAERLTTESANTRTNPQLDANGQIDGQTVSAEEAARTIKQTIENNPDLQTKLARAAGRTTPKRDQLNLIGGSYLTNQLGATMYGSNVGGAQGMGAKISGDTKADASEQKKAREEVLRTMRVPKSHEDIFRRKPKAYKQWRHGYKPKDLTPDELKHLQDTSWELLDLNT